MKENRESTLSVKSAHKCTQKLLIKYQGAQGDFRYPTPLHPTCTRISHPPWNKNWSTRAHLFHGFPTLAAAADRQTEGVTLAQLQWAAVMRRSQTYLLREMGYCSVLLHRPLEENWIISPCYVVLLAGQLGLLLSFLFFLAPEQGQFSVVFQGV